MFPKCQKKYDQALNLITQHVFFLSLQGGSCQVPRLSGAPNWSLASNVTDSWRFASYVDNIVTFCPIYQITVQFYILSYFCLSG